MPKILATILLGEGAPPGGASPFLDLVPMLLIFGVAYFLLIRPMGKEEKERRKRLAGLRKGDHVVVGGIVGRISNWDDPKIAVVEIADKVKVRVLKKEISDTLEAALAKAEAGAKPSKKDEASGSSAKARP